MRVVPKPLRIFGRLALDFGLGSIPPVFPAFTLYEPVIGQVLPASVGPRIVMDEVIHVLD
jgi:hypothetical protein